MIGRKSTIAVLAALFLFSAITFRANSVLAADKERVLHSFSGQDGDGPAGGLVFDASGSLYGATTGGAGDCSVACGTVFRLTPDSKGKWTHTVLHRFDNPKGGAYPEGEVTFDGAGNLYGADYSGGPSSEGVVFKLASGSSGKWTETVLDNFDGSTGDWPLAGVIFDKVGNLYGTTRYGGAGNACGDSGCGVVFELSPTSDGHWIKTVLHSFDGRDGAFPLARLLLDKAGNLYGTTFAGGIGSCSFGVTGCGVVFQLNPPSKKGDPWTERILHRFAGNQDGGFLASDLVSDAAGNLYGMANQGGDLSCRSGLGCGVVFELMHGEDGKWGEKVLHAFGGRDGAYPDGGGLVFDSEGNLYGTTSSGGGLNCNPNYGCGVVFKLSPGKNSKWTETVLHRFSGKDGASPQSDLLLDAAGNLYGTTSQGGSGQCALGGCGVVFEITP